MSYQQIYQKEYRKNNKDYYIQYYQKNKIKINAQRKKKIKTPEQILLCNEYQKNYYLNNPKKAIYRKNYYNENKTKILKNKKEYYQKNKEKINTRKKYNYEKLKEKLVEEKLVKKKNKGNSKKNLTDEQKLIILRYKKRN